LETLEQTLASVTKGAEQAHYSAASTARINAMNTLLKEGGVVTTSNTHFQHYIATVGCTKWLGTTSTFRR